MDRQRLRNEVSRLTYLDIIKLTALMELTSGSPKIVVGLIDGPISIDHPNLKGKTSARSPAD